MLIVGLMTGTSLDGVDASLVEINGSSLDEIEWRVVKSITTNYPADRREAIHDAMVSGSAASLCSLHADLGEWLAEAVHEVCREASVPLDSIDLIGSHGQTVWHQPPTEGRRGSTLQIGCPATIAERTGVPVISDFRTRDVAAGGQGAPLVPWIDQVLFADPAKSRAFQNIGGIGNVTRVPRRGSGETLLAFDTGPGNALIDSAVTIATNGASTYDRDGRLGRRGEVDQELLDQLLGHPYFAALPPKSTGREAFGRPMVERIVKLISPEGDQDWFDLIATLTELTARTITDSYTRWLIPLGLDEVVVTGGGALNPLLMERIATLIHPVPIVDSSILGVDPSEKEALAFAVLAWAHVKGIPANSPSATGAVGPRILGSYTPGARQMEQGVR